MLKDILAKEGYIEIDLQQTIVGHFQIEGIIDGVITDLIVDTGAASTVIDLEFAREHNMGIEATGEQGGGVGSSEMEIFKIQLKEIHIAAFSLQDPVIYAMDFQHMKQSLISKGIEKPAQGVIGADILIPHKAIIDYAAQKLYLKQEGSLLPADDDIID